MKNRKIIMVIIIVVIFFVIILFWKHFFIKQDNDLKQNNDFIETTSKVLNSGEPEKVIATVNGEEIKEKDINYKILVNNAINEKLNVQQKVIDYESLKKEAISDKILLQEAKKNDIDIDNDEKNQIEEMSKQIMSETDEEIAKEIKLTKDEYLQYSIEKQIETRIIEKMREKIIVDIVKGNINIDDLDFKQNMQAFNQSTELKKREELLQKIYQIYLTYLIDNSEIN